MKVFHMIPVCLKEVSDGSPSIIIIERKKLENYLCSVFCFLKVKCNIFFFSDEESGHKLY